MSACSRFSIALCLVGYAAFCSAAGLEAVGNTDGVLTWHLGALAHGESKREVVLFAFDATPDKVARHLDAARRQLAKPTAASPALESGATPTVWLDNGTTDFALEDTALFRWRSKRQALRGPHGGQLSQFTWYVHYRDRTGLRRAGTPHTDNAKPENLRVVEPVHRLSATAATCTLTTTDGRLRIRVRAMMGAGPTVAVEFLLANTSPEPLTDVRLSAYANIEAAHTHEGDYSVLDARTGGLLVYDPPTGTCVAMAGLTRPATGHAGTWNSLPMLQAAAGIPIAQWRPFTGLTPALKQRLTRQSVPHDIHIPVVHANPTTPVTRTLSPAEAADALERDWLFQATGEPLAQRAAKEVRWARDLAQRLAASADAPDLTAELAELAAVEKRMAPAATAAGNAATPSWIWFPEGRPHEDAPAAARLFRRAFTLPPEADVRAAVLHVTADDSCEAFLNGTRVGTQDTWERVAVVDVAKHLRSGRNVLAVRAENKPFHAANPAGLIARLVVHLASGTQLTVVTDASWRAAATPHERWAHVAFDDSAWKPARIAAPFGQGPWGRIAGLMDSVSAADPAGRKLYFAVRRIKHRIALKNPVLRFRQLLFIDQPMPQGRECIHEAIHRMGINATPGGRLLVLDGLHPGGSVRPLAPDKPGSFWRPDLSFDATRVLFCYKAHDEKSFHLYEMGLDGRNVRQLTHSDYDDVDPIYLPDGHIVFTTTRANSYVRCGPFIYSYVLARCDADGGNVYLISYNGEPDFVPALLDDGRVIYSRWEYTDKALWRVQSLWTTNQDGTNTTVFWGNQSVWPDHLSEPRPIPGSRRIMFAGVGHHDWWSGSIGIIDPAKGLNFPHGITKVTRDLRWPECTSPPVDPGESARYHAAGRFTGYKTPYPLSEHDFLVSARGAGGKFRLYLMDVDGNRELIYEGVHNVLHAIPVAPRHKPPAHRSQVVWPGTGKDRKPAVPGALYSADVYRGVPDLPRGSARFLRVFQQDHKTYSTWRKTYRNSGPPVSIVQEESVKRIVSVVPVEADGSVHFTVPPGQQLYFQLLDEHFRCLHTMRSFAGVLPGERRGCVGCHELHSATPPAQTAIALRRPPTPLSPPPWGTASISYERFVQPVLDKHCGKCHQGTGKARKTLDLTFRPGVSVFKEPYLTLVGGAGWNNPVPDKGQAGYGISAAIPVERLGTDNPQTYATLRPMQYLSPRSKLIHNAMSGKHHHVRVGAPDLRRLIAWVDACSPYMGDRELRALGDPDFPGIELLPIRPRVKTAPVVLRP